MEQTLQETLQQIPPEAWPIIEILFNVTMAAAGIWLALTVFVIWRRHASNLTPVNATSKNNKAQPDFLKVDQKARAEAIKRGDLHERALDRRDAEEARAEVKANSAPRREPLTFAQRIAGLVTFVMSVFTLFSIVTTSIFTVSRMGDMVGEMSAVDRMVSIVMAHPIPVAVCVLIIFARVYTQFFMTAKKEG
ncbi:hypothetical protein HPO_05597 [Hyphomonas polymorpha PS728]|uniref:Uncharacterized protein n=1 Tax=Hyphomonas polymorpha PS728 TaxID=1280954 RepID=A0A062VIJ0_9PROT|nr:hypothetical protein [Hyphomonas polymorpha]KCZ99385.1 hypothetical protein HPO_05597 [Hyphomonas polymorpha PS728]